MLDLKNIEVAFLDYDDTLCIHLTHLRNYDRWFEAQILEDKKYYLDKNLYAPQPGMKTLIQKLEENKIPTFGLTMTEYSTVEPLKLEFTHYYYGNHIKKMICTSTKEHKISFIKNYCDFYNIDLKNALLVDNNTDTIHMAMDAGINIRTPQEISVYFAKDEM